MVSQSISLVQYAKVELLVNSESSRNLDYDGTCSSRQALHKVRIESSLSSGKRSFWRSKNPARRPDLPSVSSLLFFLPIVFMYTISVLSYCTVVVSHSSRLSHARLRSSLTSSPKKASAVTSSENRQSHELPPSKTRECQPGLQLPVQWNIKARCAPPQTAPQNQNPISDSQRQHPLPSFAGLRRRSPCMHFVRRRHRFVETSALWPGPGARREVPPPRASVVVPYSGSLWGH